MKRYRLPGRLTGDYGMLGVLALLCALFSVLTIHEQRPEGARAARALARLLETGAEPGRSPGGVLVVARASHEDSAFARVLGAELARRRIPVAGVLQGEPGEVRTRLAAMAPGGTGAPPAGLIVLVPGDYEAPIAAMAADAAGGPLAGARILAPPTYRWPTFLLASNLRNVANQITVIAIIAIGMTMVIISAGIDLSVGSLIALSAVVTATLIGRLGGEGAPAAATILASLGGIAIAAATGGLSGFMITRFRIPPFIATLAMMQVAAGLAYIISGGKPIYRIPEGFTWLGRGADPLFGIPHAVILMAALYAAAHLTMTRTRLGRYIYAVGGNLEAARLAGIRVHRVLFIVYALSGALAGLGGVLAASQLRSGAPTYGVTYELYVIAAVVVGGASLSGGEGRILDTLIGAFIIAVIQNGMNLANIESYTQKVVLGLVILGAVLADRLKQEAGRRSRRVEEARS
jgi:ribose transport system permease protein